MYFVNDRYRKHCCMKRVSNLLRKKSSVPFMEEKFIADREIFFNIKYFFSCFYFQEHAKN